MESTTPSRSHRDQRLKNFRRYVRYYLILLIFIPIFSRIPLRAARMLGRIVGTIGWAFARTDRLRAMENLTAVFGSEKSQRELRRICHRVFQNTAINLLELLVIYRWPKEKIRRVFHLEEGFRRFDAEFPGGTVGMTAHFGNWEMLGVLFEAYLPGRIVPVAKRIYFQKFQDLVDTFRRKVGVEVIYTDESPRRMVEALRSGKILGLLPDQNLKAVSGVFVDFFGRPAYTSTAPVHIALMTGKPMFFAFLLREGDGYKFVYHGIPLARTGNRKEDLIENTRRWTRVLEEDIRNHLDQWVWFHRRWRTRPEDGPRTVGRRRRKKEKTSGGVDGDMAGENGSGLPAAKESPPDLPAARVTDPKS